MKLTRAKLEALTEELVQRTIGPCKTALKDAGLSSNDVQEIIMVGGPDPDAQGPGDGEELFR